MAIVKATLTDTIVPVRVGTAVRVRLLAGLGPGYVVAEDTTVLGVWTTRTDDAGSWSLDLPVNNQISPAGTVYEVERRVEGGPVDRAYVVLPVGGGSVVDLLASGPPGSLPSPLLEAHVAETTTAHGGLLTEADPRLNDPRAPTGPAGGVLAGDYPDPTFAEDMATQVELDAHTTSGADHPSPATAASAASAAGGSGVVGVSALYARQDHRHAAATAAPGPSGFGDVPAIGTLTSFARADHVHGREANPVPAHEAASDPHVGYRQKSAQLVTDDYADQSVTGAKIAAPSIAAQILLRGTLANRPAAGPANANLYYFTTDSPITLYQSDGSQWQTRFVVAPNSATDAKYVAKAGDSMTGQLTLISGSINNPSLVVGSSTNTGLYQVGTSTRMRVIAAGTNRIDISEVGIGINGNVPVAKASAIASPAADVAALKTAVDAIRAALTGIGVTA